MNEPDALLMTPPKFDPHPDPDDAEGDVSLAAAAALLAGLSRISGGATTPGEYRLRCHALAAGSLDCALVVELDGEGPVAHDTCGGSGVDGYVTMLRSAWGARRSSRPSGAMRVVRTSSIGSILPTAEALDATLGTGPAHALHALSATAGLLPPIVVRTRGPNLAFHRASERGPLTVREVNLARLYASEVVRRLAELPMHDRPLLPPRLRATLDWLLKGASEKEIAAELGLSTHTVHQYVKALYRVFGVTSRPQLMARCLGR